MTPEERDKLIDNFAWRVVDHTNIKDLCRIVAESIVHGFDNKSDEYVVEVISDYYPDLLEN